MPTFKTTQINITVFGQSRWASKLADNVNCLDSGFRAEFIDISAALNLRTLAAIHKADVLMRVGFRPGARTPRGIAFDTLWSLYRQLNRRACTAHFWIGTDVLNTLKDVHSGKILRPFLRRAMGEVHFAGAPWLVTELQEIGIESEHVLLDKVPADIVAIEPPALLPQPFTVLTYIPDSRPEFYGARLIYECARKLPEIRFEVVGGSGRWIEVPLPNLHFFGWQNMAEYLKRASVLVRMVEHDALGATVQQALAAARHVIYSYPLPHTSLVPFGNTTALIAILDALHATAKNEGLTSNLAGRTYALEQFNIVPHYLKMLEIVRERSAPQPLFAVESHRKRLLG